MQMAISTTGIGRTTRHMGTVSTPTLMGPSMKATGSTISSTVREWKSGRMVLSTREHISSAKKTGTVSSFGQTCRPMKAIS